MKLHMLNVLSFILRIIYSYYGNQTTYAGIDKTSSLRSMIKTQKNFWLKTWNEPIILETKAYSKDNIKFDQTECKGAN